MSHGKQPEDLELRVAEKCLLNLCRLGISGRGRVLRYLVVRLGLVNWGSVNLPDPTGEYAMSAQDANALFKEEVKSTLKTKPWRCTKTHKGSRCFGSIKNGSPFPACNKCGHPPSERRIKRRG